MLKCQSYLLFSCIVLEAVVSWVQAKSGWEGHLKNEKISWNHLPILCFIFKQFTLICQACQAIFWISWIRFGEKCRESNFSNSSAFVSCHFELSSWFQCWQIEHFQLFFWWNQDFVRGFFAIHQWESWIKWKNDLFVYIQCCQICRVAQNGYFSDFTWNQFRGF